MVSGLVLEDGVFKDNLGRTVIMRAMNFAADVKLPASASNRYVNCPCSIDNIDEHYARIKGLGFNCIRFLFTWDALQPTHPDTYDEEYIDFAIALVRKATAEYQFYVFMDPHQDIWSRHSGGSGAPLWTLHAVGFDPEQFHDTHSAMIWDPREVDAVKMQWASNYHRLVCQTMFTIFFAGPEFAPKAQINDINVGVYLMNKFLSALRHMMERFNAADLGPLLIGWESMNEPGHGLIGYQHLNEFPKSPTHVKLGTAPTPFQAMLLGQGISQTVETFKFTSLGLRKVEDAHKIIPKRGTWLDPKPLQALDAKYGWKRSWKGGCIWELHGVYDSITEKLLKPYYFSKVNVGSGDDKASSDSDSDTSSSMNKASEHPSSSSKSPNKAENSGISMHIFVDNFFVKHWVEFSQIVKDVNSDWFQFMQSPVNTPPPNLVKFRPDLIDPSRLVYTPHFYDGLTLLLKRWRWLNVDAIGVMRDIYSNPLPALRFGDSKITQCFAEQFKYLKKEGKERFGAKVALLMSEIGIPYDMDDKDAYESGYWDNQIRAMDANVSALESAQMNYALWCYTVNNTHALGDGFAGEDLSVYSKDDETPELSGKPENGIRAVPSVSRPTPVVIAGNLKHQEFNMRRAVFTLTVEPTVDAATEVFVPKYHFPEVKILQNANVTQGKIEFNEETGILKWSHGIHRDKPQTLIMKGNPQFHDSLYSYVEGVLKTTQVIFKQARFLSRRRRRQRT